MLSILLYILMLVTAVIVHEAGHTIAALLCGVKVEAFGVGFGAPYIKKKIKGIEFRLSPWLLGGYTQLKGEHEKVKEGFLSQPYHRKAIILLAGITMNLLVACICYLINYKSIILGVAIDIELLKAVFTKNPASLVQVLTTVQPNLFLVQLSLLNLFCAGFNLIPFPALDGSLLWIAGLERAMTIKKFTKLAKQLCYYGFILLLLVQSIVVYYLLV